MTSCSAQPPQTASKPTYATHGDKVKPSPVQIPAEIDPPPVTPPGSESPGIEPSQPPGEPKPAPEPPSRS